jgi:DNA polymerase III subunit delta'
MGLQLNFPGNPRVRAQLERVLESGQLAGSYLFEGPPGAGQEAAAIELAAWVIAGTVDPAHPDAGRVLRYVHPDLIYVMPVVSPVSPEKMNKDDWLPFYREYQGLHAKDPILPIEFKTNPRISVHGIRAVRLEMAKMPYEGQGRALVIHAADRMDDATQDALLKTLEEPPRNTVIILISHRPESLRKTILSRCQRLVFDALDDETIRGMLVSRGLDASRADFFAGLAGGNLEQAALLAAAESEEGNAILDRREEWLDFIDRFEFEDEVGMISAVQEFAKQTAKKKKGDKNLTQVRVDFMSLALSWYHDLLGAEARGGLRIHRDQENRRERYRDLQASQLVDRIQRFEKARGQLLSYTNFQLTLLAIFLGLRAARIKT